MDGDPELNKFLIYFYEYDQYQILQQVYSDIGWNWKIHLIWIPMK